MEWVYGLWVFAGVGFLWFQFWWYEWVGRKFRWNEFALPLAIAPIIIALYILVSLSIGDMS